MRGQKIIFIGISIVCIIFVCFRIHFIHLNAKSNDDSKTDNKVEVEKKVNNQSATSKSFVVKINVKADNIKITQDLKKQSYVLKAEYGDKLSLNEKIIKEQFPNDILTECILKKSKGSIRMQFELNNVYEMTYSYSNGVLELTFSPPSVLYEQVVVIDAGHGGSDCGAVSKDGNYYEKDINLSIAKKLGNYLEKNNIKIYYTRSEDESVSLAERVEFANKINADLFLSIHCNSTENTKSNGSSAYYSEQTINNVKDAKSFAIALENATSEALNRKSLGVFSGQQYYIVGNAKVPTVLLECAFISNNDDLIRLKDSAYQKKLAERLGDTLIKTLQEG